MIENKHIVNKIKEAFNVFQVSPKAHELIRANMIDLERQEIIDFYNYKNWHDVYTQKENIDASHLTFLTDYAVATFLPAYLLYCVEERFQADLLCDYLVEIFESNRGKKILRFFDVKQQQTIKGIIQKFI